MPRKNRKKQGKNTRRQKRQNVNNKAKSLKNRIAQTKLEISENKAKHTSNSQQNVKDRTIRQKIKDGDMSIGINVDRIKLLFLNNGIQVNTANDNCGLFFTDFENAWKAIDTFHLTKSNVFDNIKDKASEEKFELTNQQTQFLANGAVFMQFTATYAGGAIPCDDISKWEDVKLLHFLRENNINPNPLPKDANKKRDLLISTAKQVIKIKFKLCSFINSEPNENELQQKGKEIMNGRQDDIFNNDNDSGYSDDEDEKKARVKVLVNSHNLLPFDINPVMIPWWDNMQSVGGIYQFFRGMCKMMSKHNQNEISDTYDEMQESIVVMAQAIDQYASNGNTSKVPAFVIQDKEELRCIIIIISSVRSFNYKPSNKEKIMPLIVVEYFEGFRSQMSFKLQQSTMKQMGKNRMMQAISATLKEIAMISRLLRENRKKLLQSAVKEMESKYQFSWKASVLLPHTPNDVSKEKTCPVCGKCATSHCKRCGAVAYCSRECQKTHWKSSHGKQCK